MDKYSNVEESGFRGFTAEEQRESSKRLPATSDHSFKYGSSGFRGFTTEEQQNNFKGFPSKKASGSKKK